MLSYDIVVVGAGGAGMMAALAASEDPDLEVAVLKTTPPAPIRARRRHHVALGNRDPSDSVEKHFGIR